MKYIVRYTVDDFNKSFFEIIDSVDDEVMCECREELNADFICASINDTFDKLKRH